MIRIGQQLGSAVGITVTTVVFNNVGSKIGPGEDTLPMYRAAQWTSFAFGVIATTLSITFFRGVGVVGHRAPKSASVLENEEDDLLDERILLSEKLKDSDRTGTTVIELASSPESNPKIEV